MKAKLATKEYVDDINSKIDLINQRKQLIINEAKTFLHVIIPYNKMQYDKGFILISGTVNGSPYLGVLYYNIISAILHEVVHTAGVFKISSVKAEEDRLLRIVFEIEPYSLIWFDCSDYFEKALV